MCMYQTISQCHVYSCTFSQQDAAQIIQILPAYCLIVWQLVPVFRGRIHYGDIPVCAAGRKACQCLGTLWTAAIAVCTICPALPADM